ncbi:phosphoribosyltransferase [Clostridium lundense]|uniref:phosphoribosyltransferase n=1 Tax=Clostridium lundense TaxID=319475 RepID=UPI000484F0A1|nr:phosphoribosyltransferase family protein [Clostridium lundense]
MFLNREDAGKQLSLKIEKFKEEDPIILAIPRGGLEVAYESIRKFHFPWDFIITRKIGATHNKEFAIGAVCSDGTYFVDENYEKTFNISKEYIKNEVLIEKTEIHRRIKDYRGNRPFVDIRNKTVIIMDDGIATGFTIMAAIKSLKKQGAKKIIIAIPVLPKSTLYKLKSMVDEVIYLIAPEEFYAVGLYYKDFPQITDELLTLLIENLSGATI